MRSASRLRGGLVLAICLVLILPSRGFAQDNLIYWENDIPPKYVVRFSGNVLMNVKGSVETVRPTWGMGEYDNGYVLPDISNSGLTWNWGYEDESQVVGDQLNYEGYDNLPSLGTQEDSPISPGGEVVFGMYLAEFKMAKRTARFGFEFGYGFNAFSMSTAASGSGDVTYRTGVYDLNGVTPPPAPYSGTSEGPGPLIGLAPVSTTSATSAAQSASSGDLDAGLHSFKAGFWLEYPVSKSFRTSVSLGYASLYADSQYTYTETLTSAGIPNINATETVGGREYLPGFYGQLRLDYQFSKRVAAFVGAQYQWNSKLEYSGSNRNVTLDFGAMFSASVGVQISL